MVIHTGSCWFCCFVLFGVLPRTVCTADRVPPVKILVTAAIRGNVTAFYTGANDSLPRRRYFDSTLFADDNVLTNSDYLNHLQQIFQTLNKVPVLATAFYKLNDVKGRLTETSTALALIRERLSANEKSLNIRNLQMYHTLLLAIQENEQDYFKDLNIYDDKLDKPKKGNTGC